MRAILALGLIFVMLNQWGCASVTKQSKNNMVLSASQDSDVEGTGMSSADLRSMAERMAREITNIKWPSTPNGGDSIRIAFTDVNNQTRFPLQPDLIKNRLLTDLVEFSAGSNLAFTENPTGAKYFLSVQITALSKGSSEGVSDYLLYSFKIVDTADTVKWMKAYETKKQGKVGVIYR